MIPGDRKPIKGFLQQILRRIEGISDLGMESGRNSGSVLLRVAIAASLATALTACTSTSPPLGLETPGLVEPAQGYADNEVELDANGDPVLPEHLSAAPSGKPAPQVEVAEETTSEETEQVAAATSPEQNNTEAVAPDDANEAANEQQLASAENTEEVVSETKDAENTGAASTYTTATADPAKPVELAVGNETEATPAEPAPKKRGFLASVFSNNGSDNNSAVMVNAYAANGRDTGGLNTYRQPPPKRVITADNASERAPTANRPQVALASVSTGGGLPGVRERDLFEIKRRSGLDDDSDVDSYETDSPVRVASAAGLARLTPNGLLRQHSGVDVNCLKPSLVRALKTVERRFGKKVVVTSGYRSPSHNRRVRGARNSLHMYCAAADIQVPGVSKWTLAKYLRTMPGRGGVGTYCHTNSVHIDVGPERDWNWRCRRGRKRK